MTTQTATIDTKHPSGLWVLFGTEMWERFNFYGMRALLSLFLVNALSMQEAEVAIIYGGFLGLCYLTPLLGGYIADNYLGNRACIMLGGLIMAMGQFFLFWSASTFGSSVSSATTIMYVALGLIILGNGFFKPNISSMVGSLYPRERKGMLDSAFTIFYMGINLGALLGQFLCPILGDVKNGDIRDNTAFKWGFLAAGIAMVLGTIIFYIFKDKHIVSPDGQPIGTGPKGGHSKIYEEGESQKAIFTNKSMVMSLLAVVALFSLFHFVMEQNVVYSIIYSAGATLAGFILTDTTLTKVERDRILVIYIVAFFVIFFWAAFEQAGSSLTFIADNQTDRHIFGWEMPPSMVQIFNGLFVVIFAAPFSYLWLRLNKKGKEPISPVKQAIGLALIALGYLVIATQVKDIGAVGKIGIIWLIVLYLLHTFGELCLSPIGLSLVAKLSPQRFSSLLMGVWFISNACAYALSGTLGALLPPTGDKYVAAEKLGINLQQVLDGTTQLTTAQLSTLHEAKIAAVYPQIAGITIHNLYEFFMMFVVLCGVAAVLLMAITPALKKMMHGIR
ncbi:MAG TPA: peptide MFS transporter [Saprospiraceae bacterium]|nr:peptide MFS transporter [Saprospiraceae bacterium]